MIGAKEKALGMSIMLKKSMFSSFQDKLEIKNISRKYLNANNSVLRNLPFTIHKSESVVLIGLSGSGKTTLADIVIGLLKPQVGGVEIDGMDIYSISH